MEGFQDFKYFVKSLYAAIKKKIPTKVSQLTNDAGYKTTDTNTTYKLSKSGSTVTLTGSDGSTTSVTDSNTTYSSLKNPYSLTIQNNGTTVASYDGSTAKTANFTNATTSANGLMSKSDKAKLDSIDPSAITTNAANIKKNADAISAEVTRAKKAEEANTTYPVFAGATASENGTTGLVPEPTIEDAGKYLCGDGTWKTVSGGTGASDSPVEVPIVQAASITDGTIVVYKIGHLLQIYGTGLSVKWNGSHPIAVVCSIHNFDGLKLGFSDPSSQGCIATWTAYYPDYTFKTSGVVVAEYGSPDIVDVFLVGEPGSSQTSQTGVFFSMTIPLLDDKSDDESGGEHIV